MEKKSVKKLSKPKKVLIILLSIILALFSGSVLTLSVFAHNNYSHNQKAEVIFKQELQDNFINNQNTTDVFKFAVRTSNHNGCGWISIYNANKVLGIEVAISDIIGELDIWGVNLFGVLGANPLAIKNFYSRRGYKTELTTKHEQFEQKIKDSRVAILTYFSFKGGHYQTVVQHSETEIRLYNPQWTTTVDNYLKHHSDFVVFLITVK